MIDTVIKLWNTDLFIVFCFDLFVLAVVLFVLLTTGALPILACTIVLGHIAIMVMLLLRRAKSLIEIVERANAVPDTRYVMNLLNRPERQKEAKHERAVGGQR